MSPTFHFALPDLAEAMSWKCFDAVVKAIWYGAGALLCCLMLQQKWAGNSLSAFMMNSKRPGNHAVAAFTLMELLAVIVILSILFVMLPPMAKRIRASIHDTECKSNLRQLHIAVSSYLMDHQNEFPVTTVPNQSTWASDLLDGGYIPRRRVAVGDSRSEIFGCPAQRNEIANGGDKHWKLQRTYGFNYYIGRPGRKATSVKSPPHTLLLADGKRDAASISTPYNVQLIPGSIMPTPAHPDTEGKVNCLFVDGHVESRSIGDSPDGVPLGPGGAGSTLAELRYQFWQGN